MGRDWVEDGTFLKPTCPQERPPSRRWEDRLQQLETPAPTPTPSWQSAPNPYQIVALTPHLLENFPCKIGSLILGPLFSPSVHEQLHETFVNQVRPALERG